MKKKLMFAILMVLVLAGSSEGREATLPAKGSISVSIAKLTKKLDGEYLVSTGVPFGVGQLKSDKDVAFFDGEKEIPIATKVLAKWPYDDSIRSVLVQFKIKLNDSSVYKPLTMKWGEPRTTKDIVLTKVDWELPEAFILLPAKWLCDSEVIGEQVPVEENIFTEYDKKLSRAYPARRDEALKKDVRSEFYYDTAHTFYQIYVRTGEPEYFVSARKEAVKYRDTEVIKEGPEKGNTKHKNSRYIYVQAMADDYLLTGDERSLEIAGFMAEHLKNKYDPKKAFFPKAATRFWTEREF